MQVIGLDGQGRFLCAVSELELRRITQFDPPDLNVRASVTDRFGYNKWIGKDFDIIPAWERLNKLQCNRKQLDSAIRQLRACADILEPLSPLVDCAVDDSTQVTPCHL